MLLQSILKSKKKSVEKSGAVFANILTVKNTVAEFD